MQNIDKFAWVDNFLQHPNNQLQGYYNHNFIASNLGIKYLIRVPIPNAETMDYRLIPESKILLFLEFQNFPAPKLIHSTSKYSIHSYIPGRNFHDLYPESSEFPNWISKYLAAQMRKLHAFPINEFDDCDFINISPEGYKFYLKNLQFLINIFEKYNQIPRYKEKFEKLFPKDPFTVLSNNINLDTREFVLGHCDIHRKNLILQENILFILDWELSLIIDPFYDIAVHFHKMRYTPDQEIIFLTEYFKNSNFASFRSQINIYLQFEQIKSAIIDLIRYSEKSILERNKFLNHYYHKLLKAYQIWQIPNLPNIDYIQQVLLL